MMAMKMMAHGSLHEFSTVYTSSLHFQKLQLPLGKGAQLPEAGGSRDLCQFHSAVSRKVEGRAL
jgi:hypothetical protein